MAAPLESVPRRRAAPVRLGRAGLSMEWPERRAIGTRPANAALWPALVKSRLLGIASSSAERAVVLEALMACHAIIDCLGQPPALALEGGQHGVYRGQYLFGGASNGGFGQAVIFAPAGFVQGRQAASKGPQTANGLRLGLPGAVAPAGRKRRPHGAVFAVGCRAPPETGSDILRLGRMGDINFGAGLEGGSGQRLAIEAGGSPHDLDFFYWGLRLF